MIGVMTYRDGEKAPKEKRATISFQLNDDGTLHTAGLYGYSNCSNSGSAELLGDSFRLAFSGGPPHNNWQVEATGKIRDAVLDKKIGCRCS